MQFIVCSQCRFKEALGNLACSGWERYDLFPDFQRHRGHEPDGAQVPHLITVQPTEAVADKGYDWPQNHRWLRRHHIISESVGSGPGAASAESRRAADD